MKDFLKRSILKTLREFYRLEVVPTVEDLYYSLDTSELKASVKKNLFDEAFDELIHAREVVVVRIDDLFFVSTIDKPQENANEVLAYRKAYRKEIKYIAEKLNKLKHLPFLLNVSTLNLIPLKENHKDQIFVFVKNDSKKIAHLILRLKFLFRKDWLSKVKILEHRDLKDYFPERQIQNAYKLANLHPIINKNNFYENLIYNNRWVFEILGNFPVNRISLNYRGTNKKENFDVSFLTSLFNKFLGFFG